MWSGEYIQRKDHAAQVRVYHVYTWARLYIHYSTGFSKGISLWVRCMWLLTARHWDAWEGHHSNKDSGNQVTSKCKPSVWIDVEHPTLGVFIHYTVEVLHSGILSLASPDSGEPAKAIRNVRVDRAACWNGRRGSYIQYSTLTYTVHTHIYTV